MKQNGDTVAGRKIEVIFRDDAGKPEESRRLAQELIVNEKVDLLGAGLTPSALAIAPLATSAKVATVVMVSGTRIVTDRSPYLVRVSFTLGSQSAIMAGWAHRNGSRRTVIVHSDWAPGAEAAEAFTATFTKAGGEIAETLKVPLANPDFAPFLQRARDARPRHHLRVRADRTGRHLRAPVRRARHGQGRHQADRHRRHHRRRRSARHGRRRPRHGDGRRLFAGARHQFQPQLRQGVHGGQHVPPEPYRARRL